MTWEADDGTTRDQGIMVIESDITSDASGDATDETDHSYQGFLVRVEVINDTGATQPSDGWSLTMTDGQGTKDLLLGLGTSIPQAEDQNFTLQDLDGGVALRGPITYTAANMGNANGATLRLYIQRYQ